jgi:hypothetical protein
MIKGRLEVETGAVVGAAYDTQLLRLLESASREMDTLTHRHFYVVAGTYYFSGDGRVFLANEDILAITTLKTDADGDGTYEDTLTEDTDFYLRPDNRWPKTWAVMAPLSSYSGFSRRVRGVEVVGSFGYGDGLSATPYEASGSLLNGALSDTTGTSVTVDNGQHFGAGQTILVDSEQMYVKAISGNVLTVARGVNGTTAATHLDNATVNIYLYPSEVMEAVLEQAMKWWQQRATGYMTDEAKTGGQDGGTIKVYKGLTPEFKAVAKQYKRHNV